MRKGTTFGEFKQQLAKELGIDPEKQRFWTFAKRQNNTMRCAPVSLGTLVNGRPGHSPIHLRRTRMSALALMTSGVLGSSGMNRL